MARIKGISERNAPLWLRPVYWLSRRAVAGVTGKPAPGVMEPLTIAAHQSWIMSAYSFFEMALQRSRRVSFRLKELARLKVSSLTGCPW